jgi:catechol 2,3-dioxygenase-like lactoylglutathione lyase family enzyme
MINGVHAILFAPEAAAAREFLRDVLGWSSVDAGDGWLIFALPPAELAVHPTDDAPHHELFLMCDDIRATVEELQAKGVGITSPLEERGFGVMTRIRIPGAGEIGLYQPRHPSPKQD